MKMWFAASALALTIIALPVPASAQKPACGGNFAKWLSDYRAEASAQGISQRTLRVLNGISPNPKVLAADRRQGVFAQSFLKFAGRMVAAYRLQTGKQKLRKHRPVFGHAEERFGVPGPVITAFWGLETDFGGFMGDFSTLRSLATLAHDCRRPELFRPHLTSALRILEDGDLRPSDMIGAWAGELGQTQFQPTEYHETAIDFDGDGRRDLRNSVPDVIASTAALLSKFGWQRGEPWLQEVKLPRKLPWEQSGLDIKHPRSQWVAWGVSPAYGKLPEDNMQASLLLPMGRNGPAFLAYANFENVYLQWNKSLVYSITAAYFATRLDGAPRVGKGRGKVTPLSLAQTKQLQRLLKQRGYDVGKVDGIIGANTRASVRDMQLKLGLPADSYPDHALLSRLR